MELIVKLEEAKREGLLMESSLSNLKTWLAGCFLPDWAEQSIAELVAGAHWEELNDRFYQNLAFGTGGLRGRTIGKVSSSAELGGVHFGETPAHPAIGSNTLNDFNIIRATIGLYRYAQQWLCEQCLYETPSIVIAHDVRHFSRHFCELVASTWSRLGGRAFIFDGPRSTPQLSFSVRYLKAHVGVVITASHNPPHDNGFKAYFKDGAQTVSPHAEGIIEQVNAVGLSELPIFLNKELTGIITLSVSVDDAYKALLKELIIDEDSMCKQALKIVLTPIHGTGAISSLPVLRELGVEVVEVEAQSQPDANFSTVKSPNPENAEALSMGIAKAMETDATIVLATDPDGDRMGVAVRDADGEWVLFTGNQIGALLADYRIRTLKESELLPEEGSPKAALIKTFVTSPLQEAIATAHGIKTINTLTGFKWIGEKLKNYEEVLAEQLYQNEGMAVDYDRTAIWTRAELLLEYSTFVVFAGEESYGYMMSDLVRDKDANAAVLLFCEMAAYYATQEMTLVEALDTLYYEHGFYCEQTVNLYYEGAAGSQKIGNILKSYRDQPPKKIGINGVSHCTDFAKDDIRDADGKRIPPQDFFFIELDNGYSYAVRGSGTEPKIKFYIFAREAVEEEDDLVEIKAKTRVCIEALAKAIKADAELRV
jgi:phosphoglucomutase